jgi:hypothetical protein
MSNIYSQILQYKGITVEYKMTSSVKAKVAAGKSFPREAIPPNMSSSTPNDELDSIVDDEVHLVSELVMAMDWRPSFGNTSTPGGRR